MKISEKITFLILVQLTSNAFNQRSLDNSKSQNKLLPIMDFIPNKYFTLMSSSLPNNPKCELIYGNHLYLSIGAVFSVYQTLSFIIRIVTMLVDAPQGKGGCKT